MTVPAAFIEEQERFLQVGETRHLSVTGSTRPPSSRGKEPVLPTPDVQVSPDWKNFLTLFKNNLELKQRSPGTIASQRAPGSSASTLARTASPARSRSPRCGSPPTWCASTSSGSRQRLEHLLVTNPVTASDHAGSAGSTQDHEHGHKPIPRHHAYPPQPQQQPEPRQRNDLPPCPAMFTTFDPAGAGCLASVPRVLLGVSLNTCGMSG
jgi:hypothetical protein